MRLNDEIEKSSCGVGFVASRKGEYSNQILLKALDALKCQEHRGGCAADLLTADGAGIMTDIPFEILGYEKGTIAVAFLFLPKESEKRRKCLSIFETTFDLVGLEVIEYREVPIDKSVLGKYALELLPQMIQAIIRRPKHCRTDHSFDKLLYQAKMLNRMKLKKENAGFQEFFINSLSANTIVYKGLVRSQDLDRFYLDLQNPQYKTRFGLFHRRFSTNTVSTWDKAQPFRLIGHNGEINTIAGNRSWAFSREKALGLRKEELLTRSGISDSGSMNEMVEALAFRSSLQELDHVLSIMMPPANLQNKYYKFWSRCMESWDGPAMIAFADGKKVGARLDRNGFRPCRWAMTESHFYLSSEAGSFSLDESLIVQKGTLNAGTGVAMELHTGEINFKDPSQARSHKDADFNPSLLKLDYLRTQKQAQHLHKKHFFLYTEEEITKILVPMMSSGKEPIGSMGDTARLAILSDEVRSFFDFFYQNFAQVTNPPLDYLREKNVTDLVTYLGKKPNIFAKRDLLPPPLAYELKSPVLSLGQMDFVRELKNPEKTDYQVVSVEFDATFRKEHGVVGLQNRLDELEMQAAEAVKKGASIIIISDRNADYENPPIPALLALRAVIHGLTNAGIRLEASVVVDSAEIKTTHDVACIIGFGATAVCPYLALEIARFEEGYKLAKLELDEDTKEKNLIKSYESGLLKVMSKMGISVVRSYQSAKLFTIVGLEKALIDKYFPRVHWALGGYNLRDLVEIILKNLSLAQEQENSDALINNYLYREDTLGRHGEKHSMTFARSKIVHKLVRETGKSLQDIELYNEYLKAGIVNTPVNVRHLFALKTSKNPLSVEQVEAQENILKRFGAGAMSFGAISAESQRDIILAMKEIGGRSNSGEGGENPYYYIEGITAHTKQVASGRFGVTALYLAAGQELQIKIAQGAKPGEGGQLMGVKVTADIARARYSNKNVDLISPPPLHDIYSIEDLKQLIYELKQICPEATVSVKLVSGANVGTVAVGVAKAGADVIDVVGGDGGTGAAALSSMKHAGLPWEFGLIEVHQALTKNGLRKNIKLRTDGGLSTGEDIVMAAIMGAEEFNFGKLLLVAEGCVMARICEKNTCPAGITTHDPVYKAKYKGNKDHIIKLLQFIAQDVRRHLAQLGVSSLNEVVGKTELLTVNPLAEQLIRKRNLDLGFVLNQSMPVFSENSNPFFEGVNALNRRIVEDTQEALQKNIPLKLSYGIKVTDRAVPATLAGEIARKENQYRMNFYKDKNYYPYTKEIEITFTGSAGQGFGVFMTDGMKIKLYGEANDSVAKAMSGGTITILPNPNAFFDAEKNIIIGNCALYGATGGAAFIHGIAADRFAVRNSGAYAVVEGVGLHACEYMTNGKIVILGQFSQNLGSGMTGGEVYLFNPDTPENINRDYLTDTELSDEDHEELYSMVQAYFAETGSKTASQILSDWYNSKHLFQKLIPVNAVKQKKKKPAFTLV